MVQSIEEARRRQHSSAGAAGRVPPHNLEAEESLLGAMLLSRDAIVDAVQICDTDDFYKPAHGHVYDAIRSLYAQGEPVDPVTVSDELRRAGLLEAIGGPATLITLQASTPATSNAGRYARIVEEHSLLRRLIAVAGEIAEIGYQVPEDVEAAVDQAETMVFEVAQRRVTDSTKQLRDLLEEQLDRLETLFERGESITGVPTGYRDLDEQLAGLQPSNLIVVGARPSMGKCLAASTILYDPATGAPRTMAEMYARGAAGEPVEVVSLDGHHQLEVRTPSAFVDDGVKPVYRVRTRLGREVCTTMSHPFLTPTGWRPLADITVGTRVAVPRELPIFGHETMDDSEVVLLAYLLGDGGITGTSPLFTNGSPVIVDDLRRQASAFGVDVREVVDPQRTASFRLVGRQHGSNPLIDALRYHGLMGCSSHDKFVPEAIFRLPREQATLFLNRLFATDGSAWWCSSGYGRISYSSVSGPLIRGVQHLLLRFGLNARIRRRLIKYRGTRRPSYELELMGAEEIMQFAREINIFSKETDVAFLVNRVRRTGLGYSRDSIPVEVWDDILIAKGDRSWADISQAAGKPRHHNWHVGKRAPRRQTVGLLAATIVDDRLASLAASAIYWDEIVAIDFDGDQQVYDLTVPDDHNFVAADVFVHNTSFALGVVAHAAMQAHVPVLLFSLEMSHLEITQRLLCAEAKVDASRMRNGRLLDSDWPKISHAIGRLGEAPIFIDDNPAVTVMDIRAKARRLKSREGLGLVVVDYLQLMSGRQRAENRQVEISEISRNLKILARELEVPVVALSQLSRGLEMRADKRPMLADLRECLTGDTTVLDVKTGRRVRLDEAHRSGEALTVASLNKDLRLAPAAASRVFASGVKPVFRVRTTSGREIRASANHPLLTINGWRRVDEVGVGTEIAVPRIVATEGSSSFHPELARMLGYLISDGSYVNQRAVSFTNGDPEVVADAVSIVERHFGFTPRNHPHWSGTPSIDLSIPGGYGPGKNPVIAWLKELGIHGQKGVGKRVPAALFEAAPEVAAELVSGLWAGDGTIVMRENRFVARYTSVSRGLLFDIQHLLLRLGVLSRVTPPTRHTKSTVDIASVTIEGKEQVSAFCGAVGIVGRKGVRRGLALQWANNGQRNPHTDRLPIEVLELVYQARERAGLTITQLGRRCHQGKRPCRADLAIVAAMTEDRSLAALAESDIHWDRIVSIEPDGEEMTYDLIVPDGHNFVANDFIVHNSGAIEQDADVVMFLYRDDHYNPESSDRGTVEVIVAKHRSGPTGTARLVFREQFTQFANMAKV